ncbi:MAG: hypothetical protein II184_00790 [Clostridia bacterium]|nr:hypothetical protein [Clostridia bacterium]
MPEFLRSVFLFIFIRPAARLFGHGLVVSFLFRLVPQHRSADKGLKRRFVKQKRADHAADDPPGRHGGKIPVSILTLYSKISFDCCQWENLQKKTYSIIE